MMSLKREIKTTAQELLYRNKYFHDIRAVKDRQIVCTSCGSQLNIESGYVYSNPWMKILQCETCRRHFQTIDATLDENETEICYMCGHKNKLYVCSNKGCTSAFCKKCIKRNVSISLLDAENEDWECFICKPKPIWELRAVCAAVMETLPQRSNRKSTRKIETRNLPSQKEKLVKTLRIQKSLYALCDEEDDDNTPEERPSFSVRSIEDNKNRCVKQGALQHETLEINLVSDSSNTSENEEDLRRKIGENKKASTSNNRSPGSKSIYEKHVSKKNKISDDSDEDSIILSNRTTKVHKVHKVIKERQNRRFVQSSSDSQYDDNCSTNKMSIISKKLGQHFRKQSQKKDADICNTKSTKDKMRKDCDSTIESEDEDVRDKKQSKKKHSAKCFPSHGNREEEQKCVKNDKLSNKYFHQEIHKSDDSDSSGKEFQKDKKISSVRQLANLDVDYTKSPILQNSVKRKSKDEEDTDEQLSVNFNDVKDILGECKNICSNFQKYIESIEQLYGREDEETLISRCTHKIGKLTTILRKKQKDLTTFHRLWSKSSKYRKNVKKSHKVVSNDNQSFEDISIHEKHTIDVKNKTENSKNEQEAKEVSECDSEEIFSADETRSPRKIQAIQETVSKTEDSLNRTLMDKSTNVEDKSDTDSQDDLIVSPVLGTSKENKISAERLEQSIPQSTNIASDKVQSIDENSNSDADQAIIENDIYNRETQDSPLRKINEQSSHNERDNSGKNEDIINESVDMFHTSFDIPEIAEDTQEVDVVNCDESKPSSKTISLNDINKTSSQNKADHISSDDDDDILNKKCRISHSNEKEKELSNQSNQKKEVHAKNNEETHDVNDLNKMNVPEKEYMNEAESLIDAETLTNKIPLKSNFNKDISNNTLSDTNVKEMGELTIDNNDLKKQKADDNDSDVDSESSTVILFTYTEKKSTKRTKDKNKDKSSIECKANENSHDEISSLDEDGDLSTERAAKKALLESSSDKDEDRMEEAARKALLESSSDKDEDIRIEEAAKKALLESSSDKDEDIRVKETAKKAFLESNSNKDEDTKMEEAAKKALLESNSEEDEDIRTEKTGKKSHLESNSDDSIILPSPESPELEKIIKKTKSEMVAIANNKAKEALLASSNSESSCFESAACKTYASNLENQKGAKRKLNLETDFSTISAVKKRRLKLDKNYYYMNDKKLRMFCEIRITRLDKKILKQYSHALQKSRQYLECKMLKSLVNLDKLEKRHKKSTIKDSDLMDDSKASSKISKISNKAKGKQTKKETEESLMDHLKKIENDIQSTIQTDYNSDESVHRIREIDTTLISNEALISEANRAAKQNLLNSSDSEIEKEVAANSDDINSDDKNEKIGDEKKVSQKKSEEKTSKREDKKERNNKSNWKRDKILTKKFSDTDSDVERKKWDKSEEKLAKKEEEDKSSESDDKRKRFKPKKKARRRILDSDSDVKLTDCNTDSDNFSEASNAEEDSNDSDDVKKDKEKQKRKKHKHGESKSSDTDSSLEEKKPKPKRKRIKKMASDSDSDVIITSQGTPGKSGRKNIRKVLKDKQVADDTKQAAKEEEERLKRIAERQALYNEMYEMRLAGEEKVEKLVLDFDTETKEELVSVHEELVKRLKPHQAQGIKFMWDACFESLERIKTTSGSGCIIAHCMGLGKTLQVIALTHTLLSYEATGVKTVLIVCPLSTVLNWVNEYKTWLKDLDDDIDIYELTKFKKNFERKYHLQRWQKTGGVLIIGYEMFRNLTGGNKNIRKTMKEAILECLIDPGADLIVCDEGHLLKNEDTVLSKCMRMVKTMRRIVLTGTPLQNNLIEYHCMVQFVKPNLLGTKKEFLNRFVNPITNGQFDDSTAYDVKLMKKRAHVLHKMLEGSVQRFDYSVLTPFLPPKQEYVIFVRLTDTQIKMYQYYLANLARRHNGAGGALFADFQALQRIWTHPIVLRLNAEKLEKANEKKGYSSDSEGSLKNFINDDTTELDTSSCETSSDSDIQTIDDAKDNTNVSKRRTRNNPDVEEESKPSPKEDIAETEWWSQFVQSEHFEDMRVSAKLLLLFGILKECEQIGDKVLVFSQSLYSLTLIEEFLQRIDDETQRDILLDTLDNHTGSWSLGLDYFRLDGQTSAENRSAWCKIFNRPTNTRARLFLISTRAGGLGINLTAANRVIIFDASWNPSHDVQSIFRIYRFGQKKPCYVYRFLAAGTMEEKIYNRQVTKLSLSCRVVDEQQIERHYSNHDLNELYMFEPYNKEKPTLNLPKDRLLAEIFLKYMDVVENYHEHDSLLENKAEEELDEEERKQAWLEYEEEKKGKPMIPTPAYQASMLMQHYNMMNSEQAAMIFQNIPMRSEYENLQQLICKDFPNATLEQQKIMTNRALIDMYNYWERQAVLQPARNQMALPNFQPRLTVPQTATNSNVNQISQLSKLITGQSGNYANVNQSAPNVVNLPRVPNPFTYRNVPTNNTRKQDNDIIEVIPTTSNADVSNAQVTVQSNTTNKNQEE